MTSITSSTLTLGHRDLQDRVPQTVYFLSLHYVLTSNKYAASIL